MVIHTRSVLSAIFEGGVTVRHVITGVTIDLACDAVVIVADRLPRDGLAVDLASAHAAGRIRTLRVIGDAEAPHIIAQAVFAGHRAAREFDEVLDNDAPPFMRERCETRGERE